MRTPPQHGRYAGMLPLGDEANDSPGNGGTTRGRELPLDFGNFAPLLVSW